MVIYSKYNPHRKEEFELVTTIERLNEGIFSVKTARWEESEKFLLSFVEKYELLKKGDFSIEPLAPTRDNRDRIIFPYQEGLSLSMLLLRALKRADERKFFELLDEYTALIKKNSIAKGRVGKEFQEIFGNSGSEEMDLMQVGCVDLNFDNVIFKEGSGGCVLIDYEWTFKFPIPYKFVIFRAIAYFYLSNAQYFWNNEKWVEKAHKRIEISEVDIESFVMFEYAFQRYVGKGMSASYDEFRNVFVNIGKRSNCSVTDNFEDIGCNIGDKVEKTRTAESSGLWRLKVVFCRIGAKIAFVLSSPKKCIKKYLKI